jgi:hypothetical protein
MEMITLFHHRFIIVVFIAAAIATTLGALSSAGNSLSANAEVAAAPLTLSVQPAVIVGGNQATATINLGTTTNQDVEVALKSSNLEVARFGGITTTLFKIPKGSVNATVPIRTFGVSTRTDVTLEAKVGADTATARLTVDPASVRTLTVEPSKIVGGFTAKGAITLNGLAPPNAGVTVQLSRVREAASRTGTADTSTSASAASLPASVTIPPGASSASFPISTTRVSSDTSVTIAAANAVREAASRDGSVRSISDGTSNTITFSESTATSGTATLTVLAPTLSKFLLNPGSVAGGNGSIGTVALTGKAPSGGFVVSLSASSNDASVPSSITIPAGAEQETFKIQTQTGCTSRTVTIKATLARNNLQQTVRTNNLKQIDLSVHNTTDGTSNTISFGESTSAAVTANLSITPTVTSNATTLTGNTTTVTSSSTTGTGNSTTLTGSISLSSSLSSGALTITAQTSQVVGGAPVAFTLTVQPVGPCPQLLGFVALTTNHPELLQLPASVSIPASVQATSGPQSVNVNATTNATTTDQNVTITATGSSSSASTTLLIKAPPAPPTVSMVATQPNASKDGPVNGVVTVTRTGVTAQALTVLYSMNDPSAGHNPQPAVNGVDFQQLSGQVIIPAGASATTITVRPILDNKNGPELRVIFQLLAPSTGSYTIQSGSSQAIVKIKQHGP